MLKIGNASGYDLYYDESRRFFVITDTDGTEMAHGDSQGEVEGKAKILRKEEFKRIPIFRVDSDKKIRLGELTSLNRDDRVCWASMFRMEGESHGGGRGKVDLRYDRVYYELSPNNTELIAKIKAKTDVIDKLRTETNDLIKMLDKPINSEYFGLTRQ